METRNSSVAAVGIAASRQALAARNAVEPVPRYGARQARLAAAARRHRAADEAGAWCILRTSAGRTLALVRSLVEAKIDAWSPLEVRSRRRPRSKVRVEHEVAIVPSFVFVRADRLGELMAIAASPMNPHPAFSLFKHAGRVPLIPDREITSLRQAEQRAADARRKTQRKHLDAGAHVHLTEGPGAGLEGVVEQGGNGKFAKVSIGGITLKIATWLLQVDDVISGQPDIGTAALAA